MSQHILVIEDDMDINGLLQTIMKKAGYEVTAAYSGTEGRLQFDLKQFDLILCDLMLPGMSGEELIPYIREHSNVPVIVLTAKGSLNDKVNLFELGADDYMTKPFEPRELVVRVQAHLRRSSMDQKSLSETASTETENYCLMFRELTMNLDTLSVDLAGTPIELTQREFQILKTMMEHPKKVYSKEALFDAVWKQGYYGEDNTISVHISNIRKKLEAVTTEEYISTVWGIGYMLHL